MEYDEPLFFKVMQYAANADRDVVDMVSGNPDWEPPEALREGLHDYADADSDQFQYPPSEGLRDLREEIAERRNVDVEQVIVTNGAGEANYLAMARALERDAGDEVILTDPVYPYYPGKTTMLGGEMRFVSTELDGSLDPAKVRDVASDDTGCIVVNTPNNPTGAVYDRETMEELVAIAEEYDALLVADEVYDHFDFSGRFESALTIDSEHRIVTTAYSKSMAITGYRVGYAVFPESLVKAAKTRHMLVNVATSRPAQQAVLDALQNTDAEYYEETRAMLRARIDAFTDALDEAGAEYSRPDGAFYVMARFEDFPGTLDNVYTLIDEAGVAGMPGEAFGESREEWFRFALVTPRADEAAARLADYF
ncbi:Aspartate/methionine/tyrosine aminotransferase [Halogranum rubrum]|uniref:Aspartate/methionine/tyrosine aminotransferase n=1 Tax=Halogranum rubrum TaxID=553466 RepID=A0A1I4EAL8_9EURY|nr:pyridoxal phosphate-dependent aminotransferase [Halogranum rubrum]SFL02828.1 Aspartate/methionine/tyrosine aminotransferase [Halogranum rubrum]